MPVSDFSFHSPLDNTEVTLQLNGWTLEFDKKLPSEATVTFTRMFDASSIVLSKMQVEGKMRLGDVSIFTKLENGNALHYMLTGAYLVNYSIETSWVPGMEDVHGGPYEQFVIHGKVTDSICLLPTA